MKRIYLSVVTLAVLSLGMPIHAKSWNQLNPLRDKNNYDPIDRLEAVRAQGRNAKFSDLAYKYADDYLALSANAEQAKAALADDTCSPGELEAALQDASTQIMMEKATMLATVIVPIIAIAVGLRGATARGCDISKATRLIDSSMPKLLPAPRELKLLPAPKKPGNSVRYSMFKAAQDVFTTLSKQAKGTSLQQQPVRMPYADMERLGLLN